MKFYWPLSGVGRPIPMEEPALRRTLSLLQPTCLPASRALLLNALCYFPSPLTMLTMLAVPLKLPILLTEGYWT